VDHRSSTSCGWWDVNCKTSLAMSENHVESSPDNFESDFKVNFFHSATGVKPAILIGTKALNAVPNLAVFSSVFHLGSNPPIFGFMVRPGVAEGNTHDNILKTGHYTLNLVSQDLVAAAHQTAARYPAEVNEFEATGIPEGEIAGWPCSKSASVIMLLKYLETISIPYNGTKIVIGEVIRVAYDPAFVGSDGLLDHEKAKTAGVTGLDAYFSHQKVGRYAYAKPHLPPRQIPFNQ